MPFIQTLAVTDWRQFRKVEIDFHDRLTILTGVNGSGKTTLLNVIASQYGWFGFFAAIPGGVIDRDLVFYEQDYTSPVYFPRDQKRQIGHFVYPDGLISTLHVPSGEWLPGSYELQRKPVSGPPGVHIPAHRAVYAYEEVELLPLRVPHLSDVYDEYMHNFKRQYFRHPDAHYEPMYGYEKNAQRILPPNRSSTLIKQALIAFAIFGYGNENTAIPPSKPLSEALEGFVTVLQKAFPAELRFVGFEVRLNEVVVITETGRFSFESLSGGLSSIVDICWQIFLKSLSPEFKDGFVVTIDEPEAHLHPAMQRQILPGLMAAFPKVQFIVASHSPLVINSVEKSNLYVLRESKDEEFDQKGIVSELRNDVSKASTPDDALCEALGLDSAMPIWVSDRLKKIIASVTTGELTQEKLTAMKNQLTDIGLGDYISKSIAAVFRETRETDD